MKGMEWLIVRWMEVICDDDDSSRLYLTNLRESRLYIISAYIFCIETCMGRWHVDMIFNHWQKHFLVNRTFYMQLRIVITEGKILQKRKRMTQAYAIHFLHDHLSFFFPTKWQNDKTNTPSIPSIPSHAFCSLLLIHINPPKANSLPQTPTAGLHSHH